MSFMVMGRWMLLGFALCSCSAASDGGGDALRCAKTDRTGTYLVHFTERSGGTCPPVPDSLVGLDPTTPLAAGCTMTEPDSWSADECTLIRKGQCQIQGSNGTLTLTTVSNEIESGGGKFSGLQSVVNTVSNPSCAGTFDVTWTRQ